VLRATDYNISHNHPDSHVSGNFYLRVPPDDGKGALDTDGAPMFTKHSDTQTEIGRGGASFIAPRAGMGVLFASHLRHTVLPHFSPSDRIGVAFNAVYDPCHLYQDIVQPSPPSWAPDGAFA
jgi:uncharacterized protein (TIGR02466 family)